VRKPLSSAWQRRAVDFDSLLQRIIGCFTAALESMAGAGIVPTIPELGGAPAWQPGAVMRSRRVRTALAAGDHHRRTGAEPGVAGDRLQAVLIAAFGALEPGPAPGTIGITLHFGTLHFGAVLLNRHDTIFYRNRKIAEPCWRDCDGTESAFRRNVPITD
jgi:hypothetical protein